MSYALEILKFQLKDAMERLHLYESQKQFHLQQMRAFNEEQTKTQQVIDDLRKTIDMIEKHETVS